MFSVKSIRNFFVKTISFSHLFKQPVPVVCSIVFLQTLKNNESCKQQTALIYKTFGAKICSLCNFTYQLNQYMLFL